ncbi:MAG TPA: glycosyltransferase family A protein [Terracidiphilus sp.]
MLDPIASMEQPSVSAVRKRPVIVLITPVRDEEGYIGTMLETIAAQTVRPDRWIIVDDGSCDKTPAMIEEFAQTHPFIELVALPQRKERAAGGEGAIPSALRKVDLDSIDFLARFDADLAFPPDYFERMLEEFEKDPKLGIAGGTLYIERNGERAYEMDPDFHVRGALKMYRRQTFLDIGGLYPKFGWDTIDEVMAWSKGWTTRSFRSPWVLHRRPTGQGTAARRLYRLRGQAEFLTWSHPLHVFAKTFHIAFTERSLIKPVCYLGGYFENSLKRPERIQNAAFKHARQSQQLGRLASILRLSRRANAASNAMPNGHNATK